MVSLMVVKYVYCLSLDLDFLDLLSEFLDSSAESLSTMEPELFLTLEEM